MLQEAGGASVHLPAETAAAAAAAAATAAAAAAHADIQLQRPSEREVSDQSRRCWCLQDHGGLRGSPKLRIAAATAAATATGTSLP